MRLIDKEQTYQTLSEYYHHTGTLQHTALREALDRVPAVDAVPVLRCKECKHWHCDDSESYCDEIGIFGTDMNSYCSFAKRKEE